MSLCPITYTSCSPDKYSSQGLKKLNRGLYQLVPFDPATILENPYSAASFSSWPLPCSLGRINAREQRMESVSEKGKFLLFPPSKQYAQIPENLDLSLRLAELSGLAVPFHGMIHNLDGSFTCFVSLPPFLADKKSGVSGKPAKPDPLPASPLQENSAEALARMVNSGCTFPIVEKYKLFQWLVFSWLIGFEAQSTRDYTLWGQPKKSELAPPCLVFNSTLLYGPSGKEMGISLNGKLNGFDRRDFADYLGAQVLGLPEEATQFILARFQKIYSSWRTIVQESFLSEELKEQTLDVVVARLSRLRI